MSQILAKILEDAKRAKSGEECLAELNDFRGSEEDACRACPSWDKFNCRQWTDRPIEKPDIYERKDHLYSIRYSFEALKNHGGELS